jgi:hypothetical protein
MAKTRIHHKTRDRFKRAMRDIARDLGRQVRVYHLLKKNECPNCYYDKSTDSSTGKCKWSTPLEARAKQQEYEALTGKTDLRYKFFKVGRCPVCKNIGYLAVYKRQWVQCLVNWDTDTYSNESIYTQAGKSSASYVELKTDPKYLELFKKCTRIEVDGVPCRMESPPAMRGLGNQTVLLIRAVADTKLQKRSPEHLRDYI